MVYGLWFMVYGLWRIVYMVYGLGRNPSHWPGFSATKSFCSSFTFSRDPTLPRERGFRV
ncbi:hypothetical protein T484DRAFT_1953481 [Baffinella frigidus]|nr:hypothetical protein T484DRAFT_1953481 [Cryptophyta sp. CCMP2293]